MSNDALSPMETTSLADQAYRRLRVAVREGALRPGEKITERDLAARLGVSPTPVREALRQLVHEKVVERVGPRALRIADHSASARSEIVEAEVRLSALMARLAARNATDAQLAELAETLERAEALVGQIDQDLAEQGSAPMPPTNWPPCTACCASSTTRSRRRSVTRYSRDCCSRLVRSATRSDSI